MKFPAMQIILLIFLYILFNMIKGAEEPVAECDDEGRVGLMLEIISMMTARCVQVVRKRGGSLSWVTCW